MTLKDKIEMKVAIKCISTLVKLLASAKGVKDEDISDFAKDLVMDYYPGFSDAVYERRSDNMVKWCKKIINYNNR